MHALETNQPVPKKFSVLRSFSRKAPKVSISKTDDYNTFIRPSARQHERAINCTSSVSPTPLKNDSLLDVKRSPSPHLTKDKSYRKDRTIICTERSDIPQVVRERLSRESSSSSSTSNSSFSRVQADAIRTSPFPSSARSRVNVAKWDVYLPPAHVHALYMGYLPQEMSDKWFIYSEGPDKMGKLKVHFHRSWTGIKIAELFVVMDVKGEGAGKIVGIKWNGGEDIGTGRMDSVEAKYLVRTTTSWVLSIDLGDDSWV